MACMASRRSRTEHGGRSLLYTVCGTRASRVIVDCGDASLRSVFIGKLVHLAWLFDPCSSSSSMSTEDA